MAERHGHGLKEIGVAMAPLVLFLLTSQLILQGVALIGTQPARVLGPIGQPDQNQDPQENCRYAPADVHPLPPLHSPDRRVVDSHAADRLGGTDPEQDSRKSLGLDDLRDGRGDEEPGEGPRPVLHGKPVSQVHDHPGEEPSLRQAEQEPHGVELKRCFHERRRSSQDPPSDHDPTDPLPCAPLFDQKRAGDLEDEVADEENSGTETHHLVVEGRHVLGHLDRGQGHVDAVDVGDRVAQEQERKQADVGLDAGAVQARRRARERSPWVKLGAGLVMTLVEFDIEDRRPANGRSRGAWALIEPTHCTAREPRR